jgi:hypothetical protein
VEGLELPDPADTDFSIPNNPAPNPDALRAQGFDLLGTLKPNPQDGLADFVVLREPSPLEGPR